MSGGYTPGPWSAEEDPANPGWWNVEPGVIGLEGCCDEANARLIAAAPDLLEALRDLCERVPNLDVSADSDESVDACEASLARARAAIAKVTEAP